MKIVNDLKKQFDLKKFLMIIITCFISGYIVHGQMIFNKLMYHDEPGAIMGKVANMGIGRWSIWFIVKFLPFVFDITSTNEFGTFITFLLITCIAYLLVKLFDIKNKLLIVILCIICITNLNVCCAFGYMHYTIYVFLSSLLAVTSCYFLIKVDNFYLSLLLASICLSVALGLYQSCVVFYINVLLFYYIKNIDNFNPRIIIKAMIPFIIALAIYLFLYKAYMLIKDVAPSTYKNISNLGITDFNSYVERIKSAIINFFVPANMKPYTMYPAKSRYFYFILLVLLYVHIVNFVYNKINTLNILNKIFLFTFALAIPFVVNAMFIIAGETEVYAMNFYNYILIFFLLFSFFDSTNINSIFKILNLICISLTIIISLSLFKYIDVCYTNLFLKMEQEKSYGLTLISRIENMPEYSDDMKMCFVEIHDPYFHRYDDNFSKTVTFDDIISTPPYGGITDGESTVYNSYTDYKYQNIINGFNPKMIEYKEFGHEEEIKQMPIYPKAGSIKIIDNVIVVKMQDVYQ